MPTLLKKIVLLTVLATLSIVATNCSSKAPKTDKQEEVKQRYKCPMKCSEQLFDKPGKCPSCGMDLEKVSPS